MWGEIAKRRLLPQAPPSPPLQRHPKAWPWGSTSFYDAGMTAWVYIMTNRKNGTLYVGVTSDLPRRAFEHRTGAVSGFTQRHGLKLLVYAEPHNTVPLAIQREKTMKSWPRAWKVRLINQHNPNWDDLYDKLI